MAQAFNGKHQAVDEASSASGRGSASRGAPPRSPTQNPAGGGGPPTAWPAQTRAAHAETAGDDRPVMRARHIVGQLAALPRLARGAEDAAGSVAERIARRRRAAQATLEAESGAAETDWGQVGVFGAGIAIGALIGAGAALLLAPATGYETRTRLARRARQAGGRAADRWDDVSDDLRHKAQHGARRVKRAATASRWVVEDAWERRRRD
ncbi:hypothetical protein tb265_02830 [Gemmatimonadetes bacterium T265]|nr:hypothetical protein tb265_02830 [Gemmatimonadetes bacterium T265]